MTKYEMTTGKKYEKESVSCEECGRIYFVDRGKCPVCGSKKKRPHTMTTAKLEPITKEV